MRAIRIEGARGQAVEEPLAEECAIGLVCNGEPRVVLMATPRDLDDLAVGHALSEGWIDAAAQLESVESLRREGGLLHHCLLRDATLPAARGELLAGSSCGLCGAEALQEALRTPPSLPSPSPWRARHIRAGMRALHAAQALNRASGGLHAAGALLPGRPLRIVSREDVGRHNAVDKVIGALARAEQRADAMLVTSRASFELVQKTARAGIPLLAAVSAPTTAAVDLARQCGLILLAFVRGRRLTVYHGPPPSELAGAC